MYIEKIGRIEGYDGIPKIRKRLWGISWLFMKVQGETAVSLRKKSWRRGSLDLVFDLLRIVDIEGRRREWGLVCFMGRDKRDGLSVQRQSMISLTPSGLPLLAILCIRPSHDLIKILLLTLSLISFSFCFIPLSFRRPSPCSSSPNLLVCGAL